MDVIRYFTSLAGNVRNTFPQVKCYANNKKGSPRFLRKCTLWAEKRLHNPRPKQDVLLGKYDDLLPKINLESRSNYIENPKNVELVYLFRYNFPNNENKSSTHKWK